MKKLLGYLNVLLIAGALLATIGCIITGPAMVTGYDINVGDISKRRFKATRTVVNQIATQRLIDEAVAAVEPLYKHDLAVKQRVVLKLDEFFGKVSELRRVNTPVFTPDMEASSGAGQNTSIDLPIKIENHEILTTLDTISYTLFKTNVYAVAETLLDGGVKEDSNITAHITDALQKYNLGFAENSIAGEILLYVIEPNLVVNIEATEKERADAAADVEPVVYIKEQKIVDEDEYITEEIYHVLDELGFINRGYFNNWLQIIGISILVCLIFYIAALYLYKYNKDELKNKKESLLLFTLYLTLILLTRAFSGFPFQFTPILAFTLLIAVLIGVQPAIVLNMLVTLVCALIFNGDLSFLIFYAVSGVIIAYFSSYTVERNKIILISIIASIVNSLIIVGMTLFFENQYTPELITNISYAVLSGIASVIIAIGSLPFWEAVFDVLTPLKLLDLTNPNNQLLRRLAIEAPGTYHHSLIVANLAETAAFDIGANPSAARVGGYYHDIGKLMYPRYFSENQHGENLHDSMTPMDSVRVITGHVSYGLSLANEHKLPKIVKDMITQHHGKTMVIYFYYKAKKANPDEEIDADDFRYKFEIPQTREAAIIMLADTVEAAVRSMVPSGKTMDEVEKSVATLIKDKFDDGQLDESGLSIKDMTTVRKSFMRVFKGMYHSRIAYPTDPKRVKK